MSGFNSFYDVIREQRSCIHAIFSNSAAELILGLD